MLGFAVSGCGERQETASYYYSPHWVRDGKIAFIYGLQSTRKDSLGSQLSSSYTESAMTITAAGAGQALLFDATGNPPYLASCSPTTDYLAYLNDLSNDLFGKIVIKNISSTSPHTGLEKTELLFSPGIRSFDWSSDAARLVYCTTQEVRTILVSGTGDALVTAESGLEFVTWKYGGRIAFVHSTSAGKVLSLIYPDGTGRVNLSVAASVDKPQISAANTNEVYGIAGGSYCKVDVSAATPATTEISASFTGSLPRLSPAADKAVYSKTGESTGIYLLDIATKVESQLKP